MFFIHLSYFLVTFTYILNVKRDFQNVHCLLLSFVCYFPVFFSFSFLSTSAQSQLTFPSCACCLQHFPVWDIPGSHSAGPQPPPIFIIIIWTFFSLPNMNILSRTESFKYKSTISALLMVGGVEWRERW